MKNNKHPLYSTWGGMKSRCYNKNQRSYLDYGAKGITVCKEWLDNFWIFVADMGERPVGYTLDRIDTSKGYSKENCRWANAHTQALNHSKFKRAKGYTKIKYGSFRVSFKDKNGIKHQNVFKLESEAIAYYAQFKQVLDA